MKTLKNLSKIQRIITWKPVAFTSNRCYGQINENNVIKSTASKITIPNLNIQEYLLNKVDQWADKTAVICSDTGRLYTYGQTDKLSSNLAQAMCAKFKFKKGDLIAVMLPNVPEFIITFLGLFKAGLIITTINPIYTPDEIARQIKNSGAKGVITLTSSYTTIENGIKKLESNETIPVITVKQLSTDVTPRGAIDFKELCEYNGKQIKLEDCSSEDLAVIAYSSGTSGLPKGVKLSHRNIVSDLTQLQHKLFKLNHDTTKSHQDVVPMVAPFYHAYGMIPILFNMFSEGCKCVVLPKYRPDSFLNMLEKYPAHLLHLVPPILIMLNTNENAKKQHLEQSRYILSAAAPFSASDTEIFNMKFGEQVVVVQLYGLTETGPVTHTQRVDKPVKPGSIGWNLPLIESKIVSVDDETVNLGPNQAGHLLLRGPQIMDGYLNNPKATAEAIDENGWFRTGDIGYYDEDEVFYITDRIKELIKVKGYQVAPAELEAIIREHPDVDDAAVIGVNHPQQGEVPKAFVVTRNGANIKPIQVQDFVKEKVAKYKQLVGGVEFVDSIPKNPTGKILRRLLKSS